MFSRLLSIGAVVAVLMSVLGPGVGAQAPPAARPAASTAVRVNPDGTVSVKADGVAVQALLEALESVCPIQVRLDAKAAARAVSLDVSDLAPADAVGAVLKSSGLDFAMHTRCGTLTQPALVVVRLAGDGPIVSLAPRVDSDDPRVKQAIADALPLPVPGPPPEPEKREDPDTPAGGTVLAGPDDRRELAPGEVTGTQLVELLAVRPGRGQRLQLHPSSNCHSPMPTVSPFCRSGRQSLRPSSCLSRTRTGISWKCRFRLVLVRRGSISLSISPMPLERAASSRLCPRQVPPIPRTHVVQGVADRIDDDLPVPAGAVVCTRLKRRRRRLRRLPRSRRRCNRSVQHPSVP